MIETTRRRERETSQSVGSDLQDIKIRANSDMLLDTLTIGSGLSLSLFQPPARKMKTLAMHAGLLLDLMKKKIIIPTDRNLRGNLKSGDEVIALASRLSKQSPASPVEP